MHHLTEVENKRKLEMCRNLCQYTLCPIRTRAIQVDEKTKEEQVLESIVHCVACGFHFDLNFTYDETS
jgi:hypothetical protein